MKQKIFIIAAIIFLYQHSSIAQSLSDSLYLKRPTGYLYYQHGKKIIMPNLGRILQASPAAQQEYKKAQTSRFFSAIVGGAGGFLIGYPFGTLIGGGDPNWTLAAIGAGLVVINIPINSSDRKHTREAVRLYNAGLK